MPAYLPQLQASRYYTEYMNTVQTWRTVSTGSNQTLLLAKKIGQRLKGGEVIDLIGDLGAGKTTFVKGLAAGLGSQELAHSPSFTVSNQYRAANLTLHHFDFHRLNELGLMKEELSEILSDKQNVVAIEWAEIVDDILPTERLVVRFQAVSENSRKLEFDYQDSLSYLFPINT
jgi:tRNA threonylcarbamoyladenosine biosynthesis protein TsaE